MSVRTATLAALGASALAPTVVLVGPAAAGATPADDATAASHCNSASDYRLQLQANLRNPVTGHIVDDRVQLYYSPATRCVYGKFVAGSTPCGGDDDCQARVVRHNADGTNTFTGWCDASGDGICVTPRIHDAGAIAAAEGERHSAYYYYGKTGWW